jgi:hypothetical protein
VHPPRPSSVGAPSAPYGRARVEVRDAAGALVSAVETATTNHVWVAGLEADRVYTCRVFVNGHEWAGGPRRDWLAGAGPGEQGLVESGRSYDNRFRTLPRPEQDADVAFAVIGDFGTGIRRPSSGPTTRRGPARTSGRASTTWTCSPPTSTATTVHASGVAGPSRLPSVGRLGSDSRMIRTPAGTVLGEPCPRDRRAVRQPILPATLPPARGWVWRSPAGSTGRGSLASRRSPARGAASGGAAASLARHAAPRRHRRLPRPKPPPMRMSA